MYDLGRSWLEISPYSKVIVKTDGSVPARNTYILPLLKRNYKYLKWMKAQPSWAWSKKMWLSTLQVT